MTCFDRHGWERQDKTRQNIARYVKELRVLIGMAGKDRTWPDMLRNYVF